MWYEILPGLALMTGCIAAVGGVNYICQILGNKGKLRRKIMTRFDYRLQRRDEMITGKAYIPKGLEGLDQVPYKMS